MVSAMLAASLYAGMITVKRLSANAAGITDGAGWGLLNNPCNRFVNVVVDTGMKYSSSTGMVRGDSPERPCLEQGLSARYRDNWKNTALLCESAGEPRRTAKLLGVIIAVNRPEYKLEPSRRALNPDVSEVS